MTVRLQFLPDPFIDQFLKLFVMLVGATLIAGALWRFNYRRRKKKRREEWMQKAKMGHISG